jgi:hypothetical protein
VIWFIGNLYFSIGYSREKRELLDHLLKIVEEESGDE